jgi:hypothetical protein
MRQVPPYTIIGNGRVARHFCNYLTLLGIPFLHWFRQQGSEEQLEEIVRKSARILVLISDRSIDPFIEERPFLREKILIHFSGAHVSEYAYGTHPLMSFGWRLYNLVDYQRIPFVIDERAPDFATLLPGLQNPHFRIAAEHKPYYHALCVMANNFTTVLWQKFFDEMETRFELPHTVLQPFLEQTTKNLIHDHKNALSGPLVRNDQETIQANINALKDDAFLKIYQAFLSVFQKK